MFRNFSAFSAITLLVVLASYGGGDAPSDAPANVKVTSGNGRAIVQFQQQPD